MKVVLVVKLNLNLPDASIPCRANLLNQIIPYILNRSVVDTENDYTSYSFLKICIDFVEYDLTDAPPSSTILNLNLFPWNEAHREYDFTVNFALTAYYKAAIDHLRRALELVVVGAYFTEKMKNDSWSSQDNAKQARSWINSHSITPYFNKALKELANSFYGKILSNSYNWEKKVLDFYYSLSDVVHVKGYKNSSYEINPSSISLGGKYIHNYNRKILYDIWDKFIFSVQHSSIILTLMNPRILIPSLYDVNQFVTGHFAEKQIERLQSLFPEKSKSFFNWLKTEIN